MSLHAAGQKVAESCNCVKTREAVFMCPCVRHRELKELKPKRFYVRRIAHRSSLFTSAAGHLTSQRTTAPALGINTCATHAAFTGHTAPRRRSMHHGAFAPLPHALVLTSITPNRRAGAAAGGAATFACMPPHRRTHLAHGACRGVHRLSPWRPRARALAPSPGHPWLDQGSWRRSPRRRRRRRRRTRPRLRPWTLHRWRS